MDKEYYSNIEEERLPIEEFKKSIGKNIIPEQIWRDGAFINESPHNHVFEDFEGKKIAFTKVGEQKIKLIQQYEKLLLSPIEGTESCSYYCKEDENALKDIIDERFDPVATLDKQTWTPQIYINDTDILPYKIGNPYFDGTTGILTFRDKDFIKSLFTDHPNAKIFVSFYKYIGRKGFFGYETGDDFPFKDNNEKHLLKNGIEEALTTLDFKVRGAKGKNTSYIMPPIDVGNFTNGTGYYSQLKEKLLEEDETSKNNEIGVVVLEENINSLMYAQGKIDGGLF